MIREARRHNGDIPAAAPALGIALTDHATVLARATAAVARIEAGMALAQRSGVLHEFNQEYRRRQLEAQGRGERFMGYAQAMARLRRAMIKVATTGTAPVAILREVFGVAKSPFKIRIAQPSASDLSEFGSAWSRHAEGSIQSPRRR